MPSSSSSKSGALMFKALIGVNGFLALLICVFVALFYAGGSDESAKASDAGKQLHIAVKDGAVTGNMRKSASETPSSPTQAETSHTEEKPDFDVGGPDDAAQQASDVRVDSLVAGEEEAVQSIRVNPRTPTSLPEAPLESLQEASEFGAIPKSSLTNSPFKAYARPMQPGSKPVVAIIITDLGRQNTITDQIISLPADVTLAISPYSKQAPLWVESARNMGHETWLMLPVQPQGFPASDPGPLAILNSLSDADNEQRLKHILAQSVAYPGVVIPPNEAISESAEKLAAPLKQLGGRGLAVLTTRLSQKTQASAILGNAKQQRLIADRLLDESLAPDDIAQQFKELEATAVQKGRAVGVLRPFPVSIKALEAWMANQNTSPVQIVPLTVIFNKAGS